MPGLGTLEALVCQTRGSSCLDPRMALQIRTGIMAGPPNMPLGLITAIS